MTTIPTSEQATRHANVEEYRQRSLKELDLIRSYVNSPKCQVCKINPAIFTVAEIHIRMVAMLYPAFWFNMDYLPTVAQTRSYIWQLSGQDAGLIEYAKNRVRFKYGMSELGQRLDWLRVLSVVKELTN